MTAKQGGTKVTGMLKRTPMGSKITKVTTNGDASRKCQSFIDCFIESTEALESPRIFRKWAAISMIAATLEQRVYIVSGGDKLHANLYCALIGHAGTGKTRSIYRARDYYMTMEGAPMAPTSMSASSMKIGR